MFLSAVPVTLLRFIITDDLKVVSSSIDYVLNTLRGLGYANAYKLGEISFLMSVSMRYFVCIMTG